MYWATGRRSLHRFGVSAHSLCRRLRGTELIRCCCSQPCTCIVSTLLSAHHIMALILFCWPDQSQTSCACGAQARALVALSLDLSLRIGSSTAGPLQDCGLLSISQAVPPFGGDCIASALICMRCPASNWYTLVAAGTLRCDDKLESMQLNLTADPLQAAVDFHHLGREPRSEDEDGTPACTGKPQLYVPATSQDKNHTTQELHHFPPARLMR